MLRSELGFKGFVVTDYQADLELVAHGYASDWVALMEKIMDSEMEARVIKGLYIQCSATEVKVTVLGNHVV